MKPFAAALPCRPPAASWPPICAWRPTATAPVPRRLLPARPGLPGGATAVGSRWASVPSHRASHQATATAPVLCSRPSETLQGRQHPSTTQAAGKQTVQEKRPGHCRAPWPRAQPPGEGRQAPSELPPPRLRGDTSSAGCPTHSRDDPESRCWPQAARPVPCGEAGFPRAVQGGRLGQSDQGSVQNHAADRWPSWERKPVLAHGYTLPCRLHPQAPQGDRDQRERPAWDSHLLLGGEAQHAPRGADSSTESTRPDLKTGGRPEQTSFQRRHTGGQRAQGKGLNGADGQGDASQATMGVTSGDRRDDRREWGPGQSPSCAAGMYSPTGAMGSGVGRLKTASTELPYDPANPASGTPPEEIQNAKSQRYLHPCAHCSSTEPGRGGNRGVPTGGRLRKMLSIPAAGRQPATRDRDGPPRRQLGRTWRPLLSARNQTRDKCCGGPPRRGPDGGLRSKTRAGARGVAGAGARPPDTRRLSSRAVHTTPTARDGVLST